MIINDRIRNMDKSEKMKYLLTRLLDDLPRTTKDEIIEQISRMSKGIDPADFLKEFNLKGEYDSAEYIKGQKGVDTTPSIRVDLDEGSIKIEISERERRWFVEPQPVAPERLRSFLPQDELDELNANG